MLIDSAWGRYLRLGRDRYRRLGEVPPAPRTDDERELVRAPFAGGVVVGTLRAGLCFIPQGAAACARIPLGLFVRERMITALSASEEASPPRLLVGTEGGLLALTQDAAIQQSLRDLLKREPYDDGERMLGEYSGLGGEYYVTKAGDVFACPHCGHRYPIGEDGEQPVPCERHPKARLEKVPPEKGA